MTALRPFVSAQLPGVPTVATGAPVPAGHAGWDRLARLACLALLCAALAALMGLPAPAPAQAGTSLAIDAARVDANCRRPVFARPDQTSPVVSRDTGVEYLVSGVMTNAQGGWYEVIYPVRGWMREMDARFATEKGYDPASRGEEERLRLRLLSDIGFTPERWEQTMGPPWAGEVWTETRQDGEFEVRTAMWPGVAVATERQAGGAAEPVLTRGTMCGRAAVGFGPYAVGEPGAVLRRIDPGFSPGPYAVLDNGHWRAMLDADGVIALIAWSGPGGNFLSCPELSPPSREAPFYPGAVYPEPWCRARNLKVGLVVEGEYGGVDCDEDCAAEIRLDTGGSLDLFTSQEEAERWFGDRTGARVRAVYNVEQEWDSARGTCAQTPVLQSGRVLDEAGTSEAAARRACRSMVVGQGEARGELTVAGEAPGAMWEILLDSDRPMAFRTGEGFTPGARPLAEGARVAVRFERVMGWDEEEGACVVTTVVRTPPRVLPAR